MWLLAAFKGFQLIADPVAKITSAIVKAKADSLNAKTEQERIEAGERVSSLQAKRDVMIAESGASRINGMIRAAMALPVAVVLWKIFVYDKALGQWTAGHTDALSPELWQVVSVVIGFYFLYEGAIGVTRILKR